MNLNFLRGTMIINLLIWNSKILIILQAKNNTISTNLKTWIKNFHMIAPKMINWNLKEIMIIKLCILLHQFIKTSLIRKELFRSLHWSSLLENHQLIYRLQMNPWKQFEILTELENLKNLKSLLIKKL